MLAADAGRRRGPRARREALPARRRPRRLGLDRRRGSCATTTARRCTSSPRSRTSAPRRRRPRRSRSRRCTTRSPACPTARCSTTGSSRRSRAAGAAARASRSCSSTSTASRSSTTASATRAGDWLLQQIGARLTQAVRASDSVARFGGDEFVILFDGVADEAMAMKLTDRVRRELMRPFSLEGDEDFFATGQPRGRAQRRRPAAPPSWCATPTRRCTGAKAAGGAQSELFDHAMRDAAVERLRTERALRQGLPRDELRLHYQPIFDLESRRDRGRRGARALGAPRPRARAARRASSAWPRSAG